MAKKINEMNAAAGGAIAGAFKPAGSGAVFPKKTTKTVNNKKLPYKKVAAERRSETMLREAIRNLIFLNRIKYHEENAKREMQEQKLRNVIRYLLKEADDAQESGLSSTGQTAGYAFLKKIEKTTFQNDFQSLKSSEAQRQEFKKVYLTGIKIYLDALDQQYIILNPDQAPGQAAPMAAAPATQAGAPEMATPPARRSDKLTEQDVPGVGNVAPAAAGVASQASMDTGNMQKQAVASAISATQSPQGDITGRSAAENSLKRDLPQIDPLYFNLTFKEINIKGTQTNDRKEFRTFLIGDQAHVGNIQIKFKEWSDKAPIGGEQAGNTPILDVPPLEPASTTPAPAPQSTQPVGGSPAPEAEAPVPEV